MAVRLVVTGEALPQRNLYGFADPTPARAFVREWWFVTLDELCGVLADKTGHPPRAVEHLVRAWIRDGLLPRPKVVPIPGHRGTRGDYTDAHVIGFLAVKRLRPRGKPVDILVSWPDWGAWQAYWRWFARYATWLREAHGLRTEEIAELEREGRLPQPPAWLEEERRSLPQIRHQVYRLRLNTQVLARLMPWARRWPDNPWLDGDLTPAEAAEATGLADYGPLLVWEALREIWRAVAAVETGIEPERVYPGDGDAVAVRGDRTIWRLSESKWRD